MTASTGKGLIMKVIFKIPFDRDIILTKLQ